MSRPYFITVRMNLTDEANLDPGEVVDDGFGMRIVDPVSDIWTSDIVKEQIDSLIERAAARETRRDQRLAAPFWKRWLGGV